MKVVMNFVYERVKSVSQIGLLLVACLCIYGILINLMSYSLVTLENKVLFMLLLLVQTALVGVVGVNAYKFINSHWHSKDVAAQLENEILKQNIILNAISDALIILDEKGKIKAVNRQMCQIIGLDEAFIINKAIAAIVEDDEKYELPKLMNYIQKTLKGNTEYKELISIKNKDGYIQDLNISTYILRDENNIKTGVLSIIKDVTAKRKIESRIMQIEKLSTAGSIAASLAHEIKNPICSIKGLIQMMSHNACEKDSKYYHVILDEIDRISNLLKNFLSLTQTKTVFELSSIEKIFTDLMPLLESYANSKNIRINTIIEPNLPQLNISKDQIKQVILNITQNAIEALQINGLISIRVFKNSASDMLKIEVIDNGPGIQAEYLKKIFDPFFTTKDTGSGLGLPISNKIIENHEGRIYVINNEDRGCTFVVELPMGKSI